MTVEALLRPGPRSYFDHELPAVSLKVVGKRQEDVTFSLFSKFYHFVAMIVDRGGDLDALVNNVQLIGAQLENLLESQSDSTYNLTGLGTHADMEGGPVVRINGSVINYRQDTNKVFTVVSTIDGEIEIVMA